MMSLSILKQLCELIPPHLVPKLAREHGIQTRRFSPWSHVVSHLYGQLSRAVGLNDICDGLSVESSRLRAIRGATVPKRNTFSYANRTRPCELGEALYWKTVEHLCGLVPGFGGGTMRSGYLRRFKSRIFAVDSTTITLVAQCMDWARHRRRKAAAKCHLQLDLRSLLPRFAVVDTARLTDNRAAWEVCGSLKEGEIVVFDRAYMDFGHLACLHGRGVCWVTRERAALKYRVLEHRPTGASSHILSDEIIELTQWSTRKKYADRLRRVTARVEINGEERVLVFLTNHLGWSAWSVAELYRARWDIEVFFKELKQSLQLVDFVGHNRNAVCWQIWMALLAHLLVRFAAYLSRWSHPLTRLFTLIRAAMWKSYRLQDFLSTYGTAGAARKMLICPKQIWLPGLGPPGPIAMGQPTPNG